MQYSIEQARKGKRAAFTALYEAYWKEVKFISYALLGDHEAAGEAVVWAFGHTWESVTDGSAATEEEFRKRLLGMAASYCRRKLLKKGQKTLPLPPGQNFTVSDRDIDTASKTGDGLEAVLHSLPAAGRFIFVLDQAAGCSRKEIASLTGVREQTVKLALEAQPGNTERILAAVWGSEETAGKHGDRLKDAIRTGIQESTLQEAQREKILDGIAHCIEPFRKKRQKNMLFGGAAVCLAVVVLGVCLWMADGGSKNQADGGSENQADGTQSTEQAQPAESENAKEKDESVRADYYAEISIEDYGTITIALDREAAPQTVENFVSLAESGFYNGLTFHRIMEGFMMQGGDPSGDGTGGSEQTIPGEFTENGYENPLSHTRGAVSMARSNEYDSASSQFFIVHQDSTFLDGQYAVFGYVTEGMDVVDAVCTKAEPTDGNGTIPADQQPVITSVEIREADETE